MTTHTELSEALGKWGLEKYHEGYNDGVDWALDMVLGHLDGLATASGSLEIEHVKAAIESVRGGDSE